MRVLIAEDDSALANFVRKGLEAEHYAVDVTTDGEQAWAMAGEMDYDLLMLDLNLPRVDGITTCARENRACRSWCSPAGTGWNTGCYALDLGADDTWAW
jgi:DNA-binding response OmpR family regulator